MGRGKRQNGPDDSGRVREAEPRVLWIAPDGRSIVDPMSILGSDSFKRHLNEIKDIPVEKRDASKG